MKSIVVAVIAFAAITFSSAEDDGKYRPYQYGGDDGKYHPSDEERYSAFQYRNYLRRIGKYNSIFSPYRPVYYSAYSPFQPVLTPVISYNGGGGNSDDQTQYASSDSAVTYRPLVSVPVQPVIYSKDKAFTDTRLPVFSRTQYYNDRYANILRLDTNLDENNYHYLYRTDNGIDAEEYGNTAQGGTKARGFYEYVGDNGQKYRVNYIADENGFQPEGAHLPKAN